MTEEKDIFYDEIVDRNLKRLQTFTQKKDIINDIAREFKADNMRVEKISSEIKRRMRDHYGEYDISDRWIEKCLDDEFKRPKKIPAITEQNSELDPITEQNSQSDSITNEEKKAIEQSITTSGITVSEPKSNTNQEPTITDPNDPDFEPPNRYDSPPPPTNQEIEVLKKGIQDRDSRISNLEQQLKTISERKPEQQKPISNIKLGELQIDDGKTFDNTIYLSCIGLSLDGKKGGLARNIANNIYEFLEKFPELPFILAQQDNGQTNVRLNFTKPQFITGNPH
jgi:hypothetical protein